MNFTTSSNRFKQIKQTFAMNKTKSNKRSIFIDIGRINTS